MRGELGESGLGGGGCAGRQRPTPGGAGELDGYSSFRSRGRVSRVPGPKELTSLFRFLLPVYSMRTAHALFDSSRSESTRFPSGQSDTLRVEKAAQAEVLPLRCMAVRHACCVDETIGALKMFFVNPKMHAKKQQNNKMHSAAAASAFKPLCCCCTTRAWRSRMQRCRPDVPNRPGPHGCPIDHCNHLYPLEATGGANPYVRFFAQRNYCRGYTLCMHSNTKAPCTHAGGLIES